MTRCCACAVLPHDFFSTSRGENSGSQTQEVLEQLKGLKAQISELEAQEKELDLQKAWLDENNTHLNHDPITSPYPFMPSGSFFACTCICIYISYFKMHLTIGLSILSVN